jgi:hypothetical protein
MTMPPVSSSHDTPIVLHNTRIRNTTIFALYAVLQSVSGARGGLFGAGGRFKGGTDPIMEKFNESIGFDKR